MIIDERKIGKIAKARTNTAKGFVPSLKFARGGSKRAKAFERVRLAVGIFVALAMAFASLALLWTLAQEAGKGVQTAQTRANLRPPNASDVQVIFKPAQAK